MMMTGYQFKICRVIRAAEDIPKLKLNLLYFVKKITYRPNSPWYDVIVSRETNNTNL